MRIRMFCCAFLFLLFISTVQTVFSLTTPDRKHLPDFVQVVPPVIIRAPISRYSLSNGPKTFITQQQINQTGLTSLTQTLQSLGGVQFQDPSGNGTQALFGLRGFGANASSNTLFLINGIPLTNPDMMPPDINAIPIQDIEYIEIIAGSESVLYGDQAVGGIINIMMNGERKEKVEIICTAGSYQERDCTISIDQTKEPLNYHVTVSTTHTNHYRNHNEDDQNLLLGRFDYRYAKGKASFNYQIANEDMQYPGALTTQEVRQNRRQASNQIDFFKNGNGLLHYHQEHFFTQDWQLKTDIASRIMLGHGVLFSSFNQARKTFFVKPTIEGMIQGALLQSGLDLEADEYHLGSVFGVTNNHQQKYSVFALMRYPLHPKLTISIGARGAEQFNSLQTTDTSDTLNRAFATTIGFHFLWTEDIDFYLRRAESFRFPKADELQSTPLNVTSLRTQRGVAYETGFEYRRINNAFKLGLFQLDLKDEIAFDPLQTPQQPFGANRNLAPTKRTGFTLSGKTRWMDKIILDGQYNYVNARFRQGLNSGNRIPLVSEQIIRGGLDYQLNDYWNIYAEALFTGNQYPANDDANTAGKIGGYTVYNLNLRFHYQQLTASLRLNNIFNKEYYFYTVSQFGTELFYPAPERNMTLTMRYAFL